MFFFSLLASLKKRIPVEKMFYDYMFRAISTPFSPGEYTHKSQSKPTTVHSLKSQRNPREWIAFLRAFLPYIRAVSCLFSQFQESLRSLDPCNEILPHPPPRSDWKFSLMVSRLAKPRADFTMTLKKYAQIYRWNCPKIKYSFDKVSTMLSNRNGTMERHLPPRPKTWKTVRQTRNQDAAHAHKRATVPLRIKKPIELFNSWNALTVLTLIYKTADVNESMCKQWCKCQTK